MVDDLHGQAGPFRERRQRGGQATLPKHRWMHSPGEFAQPGDGALQLRGSLHQHGLRLVRVGGPAGPAEHQGCGDKLLLGSVVDVALQPTPLGVAGRNDPLPGLLSRLQLELERGSQPQVLQQQRGAGPHRLQQFGLLQQRLIVHERTQSHVTAIQSCHYPRPGNRTEAVKAPLGVDVFLALVRP